MGKVTLWVDNALVVVALRLVVSWYAGYAEIYYRKGLNGEPL